MAGYPSEPRRPAGRPQARYPENGGSRGTRYRGDGYPDERYPDERYPDERYPDERYPDERYPDDPYRNGRYGNGDSRHGNGPYGGGDGRSGGGSGGGPGQGRGYGEAATRRFAHPGERGYTGDPGYRGGDPRYAGEHGHRGEPTSPHSVPGSRDSGGGRGYPPDPVYAGEAGYVDDRPGYPGEDTYAGEPGYTGEFDAVGEPGYTGEFDAVGEFDAEGEFDYAAAFDYVSRFDYSQDGYDEDDGYDGYGYDGYDGDGYDGDGYDGYDSGVYPAQAPSRDPFRAGAHGPAGGRDERPDDSAIRAVANYFHDTTGGAEGNERLTALTGSVLLVLFAAEGFTILAIRQMLTVHFFLGMLLVGPVALKASSTVYRFARYYTGAPEYRRKGPPAPLLRLLGPFVLITSVSVIGTGIMLAVAGPNASTWLFLHKAAFVLWFGVMTIHVLAYVWRLPRHLSGDLAGRMSTRAGEVLAGRSARWLLLTAALLTGLLLALLTYHRADAWTGFNGIIG